MAFTPVPGVTDGEAAPSADWWNTYIRDNMGAMFPEAATAKGDILAATGADAGAIVSVGVNNATLIANSQATAGMTWSLTGGARVVGSPSSGGGQNDIWGAISSDLYGAETFDVASAMSGGTFTAPFAAFYLVIGSIMFDPGDGVFYPDVNDYAHIGVFKNGVLYSAIDTAVWEASAQVNKVLRGGDIVYCQKGDTLQLARYTQNGNTTTIVAISPDYNTFTIMPIPT